MPKDPSIYLDHILAEIEFLEGIRQTKTYDQFRADAMAYRAAVYSLQCISEAVKNLPESWLQSRPEIRWRDIRGIGNHTRHAYANLLPFLIWDAIIEQLAGLKIATSAIKSNVDTKSA